MLDVMNVGAQPSVSGATSEHVFLDCITKRAERVRESKLASSTPPCTLLPVRSLDFGPAQILAPTSLSDRL